MEIPEVVTVGGDVCNAIDSPLVANKVIDVNLTTPQKNVPEDGGGGGGGGGGLALFRKLAVFSVIVCPGGHGTGGGSGPGGGGVGEPGPPPPPWPLCSRSGSMWGGSILKPCGPWCWRWWFMPPGGGGGVNGGFSDIGATWIPGSRCICCSCIIILNSLNGHSLNHSVSVYISSLD